MRIWKEPCNPVTRSRRSKPPDRKPAPPARPNGNPATPSNATRSAIISYQQQSFSGPLPPPALLREYEEITSGFAAIIVEQFQKQGDHRMWIEKRAVEQRGKTELLGQVFAFFIGAGAIVGGTLMVKWGAPASGVATIIAAIGSLVGLYLYGRHQQTRERERRFDRIEDRMPPKKP